MVARLLPSADVLGVLRDPERVPRGAEPSRAGAGPVVRAVPRGPSLARGLVSRRAGAPGDVLRGRPLPLVPSAGARVARRGPPPDAGFGALLRPLCAS